MALNTVQQSLNHRFILGSQLGSISTASTVGAPFPLTLPTAGPASTVHRAHSTPSPSYARAVSRALTLALVLAFGVAVPIPHDVATLGVHY